MSQIDQFLAAMKRALKAKNIIYKDLAESLDLSESSVKRILSDKSIGLDRIEEICKACDISFAEICKNANFEEDISTYTLSKDQEKILADNPRLLHYFILLNDGLTSTKIEKDFEISNNESKKLLLQLDKLNLIELHPRDRVKMKNKSGVLRFRRDGAVGKTLFTQTKNNYLNYDFDTEKDYIRFSNNSFTQESLGKFKKKLDKLVSEIQEEARLVDRDDKSASDIGILLAYRPWEYSSLDAIKKR
ncbi:MAG: helix-turn-helix transcriptional regulator [Rhizobacter sp.]|nr:helix-turn-helix transcriptional regulator [Bacteriovorax sp.]